VKGFAPKPAPSATKNSNSISFNFGKTNFLNFSVSCQKFVTIFAILFSSVFAISLLIILIF